MRLEELNWMDVENYLKKDDRLLLILGSCEQHGYLSLLSDTKIPLALADAASQQSGVLVAPPLSFGSSPYFLNYPGTLSLRVSTLLDAAEDIVRSAFGHGFRRILMLNGHGGNEPVRGRMYELVNQLPDIKIAWYSWWTAPGVTAVAEKHGLRSYHAAWIEAFPFTRVADLPDGSKPPAKPNRLLSAVEERQAFGDGVFGGPYQVEDAIMQEIFDAALLEILELL